MPVYGARVMRCLEVTGSYDISAARNNRSSCTNQVIFEPVIVTAAYPGHPASQLIAAVIVSCGVCTEQITCTTS